jgi:hypothetical protein
MASRRLIGSERALHSKKSLGKTIMALGINDSLWRSRFHVQAAWQRDFRLARTSTKG